MMRRALLQAAAFCLLGSLARAEAPAVDMPAVALPAAPAAAQMALDAPMPLPAQEPPAYHSLLFTVEDMDKIFDASHAYLANMQGMRSINQLSSVAGLVPQQLQTATQQAVQHPQYYLQMLVFRSGKEWTLKLNDRTFTAQAPESGDLRVVSVNKTSARFAWKPNVFTLYENRLPQQAQKGQVQVDKATQTVEFTLYVNQSFSAYSMSVEEGYLPPVRVEQFTTAVNVNPGLAGATGTLPAPAAPAR